MGRFDFENKFTKISSNVFAINSGNEISNELIDHCFNIEKNCSEIVFRPKIFTLEDTVLLDKELCKENYYYQLGFLTHKDHLQRQDTIDGISYMQFKDIQEARHEVNRTIDEHFFQLWPNYVYKKLKDDYGEYIDNHLPLEHTWNIMFKDQHAGILTMFPSTDCLKNDLMQIGWVWINQNIDSLVRKEIREAINNQLIDRCNGLIQAGVAIFNIKSKKFFLKLGFGLKCIHVIKKQHS